VWGDEVGRRVVCLHGVTSWGGHFAELARELPGTRVLAPDLLGHGASPQAPPWGIEEHVAAVTATAGDERATWIGHSFGARLAFELAARTPSLVERLVLLDPAIRIAPHVALFAAENARRERAYASFAAAIDARYAESALHGAPRELVERELQHHLAAGPDGRWRYRYSQSAVVAAYGALATEPPGYESVRVPTLLVLGERSYVPYDHLLDAHAAAVGDLLRVVRVAGGHTVLWDALAETSAAIRLFLDS
jgi:lipase